MAKFKFTVIGATAAITLLSNISPAGADMTMTGNYGAWKTYAGTAGNNGLPMCSAILAMYDRQLMLKYQDGEAFIQVAKIGWHIPGNRLIEIVMQVDNADPITLKGTSTSTHGDIVHIPLRPTPENQNPNVVHDIIELLGGGLQVQLYFPEGTEQPWQGSLIGSAAAIGKMAECMHVLNGNSAPSTQPYSSQPFGNRAPTPRTTQPYTPL